MRVFILTDLVFVVCDVGSETSFSIDFGRLRTVKQEPLDFSSIIKNTTIKKSQSDSETPEEDSEWVERGEYLAKVAKLKEEFIGHYHGINKKDVFISDVNKIMICLVHNSNTINKDRFIDAGKVEGSISDSDKKLILKCLIYEYILK